MGAQLLEALQELKLLKFPGSAVEPVGGVNGVVFICACKYTRTCISGQR